MFIYPILPLSVYFYYANSPCTSFKLPVVIYKKYVLLLSNDFNVLAKPSFNETTGFQPSISISVVSNSNS